MAIVQQLDMRKSIIHFANREDIMLGVEINQSHFEYDVRTIIQAFYAENKVTVITPEIKAVKREELLNSGCVKIKIQFEEEQILLYLDNKIYNKQLIRNTVSAKEYKDLFNLFLYEILSEYTGQKLPWGNLTGIRPTKIAYGMLEEGKTEEDIIEDADLSEGDE